MPDRALTADDLTCALYNPLRASSAILVPRYTPLGWFECDLCRVTKTGYLHEYEVKVSLGDFRADAAKAPTKWQKVDGSWGNHPHGKAKHDRLANGDTRGPVHFWYVVPSAIADAVQAELPAFAGLIAADRKSRRVTLTHRVKAPRLHKQKANPLIAIHVASLFPYRFWNLYLKSTEDAHA